MNLVVATVRHDTFQPVHLPDVPRDDVGDVVDRLRQRVFAELGTVVFHKRGKHGFTGDEQAVALPFVGIDALESFLRGFQPFAGSSRVFSLTTRSLRSSSPMRSASGMTAPVVAS